MALTALKLKIKLLALKFRNDAGAEVNFWYRCSLIMKDLVRLNRDQTCEERLNYFDEMKDSWVNRTRSLANANERSMLRFVKLNKALVDEAKQKAGWNR